MNENWKRQEELVNELMEELKTLHEDPIFKREAEIRQKLIKLSYVEYLGLSTKTKNCLKRAGMNLVSDIIDYPKDHWPWIRGLGQKSIKEIEDKVRELGYTNFSIY